MERRRLDRADERQLGRILSLVRDVLGPDVIAAYLFGSAVLGGLRPQSDLDVLVVSKRPTTRVEKQRLVERLLEISGCRTAEGRWRRVELTVVVEVDIKPWRYPPSFDFQYGDWLRSDFEAGNLEPWSSKVNPDLATLMTMVLLRGEPLFGPPASEIFDPVPHDDMLTAMVSGLHGLLDELDTDTRNVVLTLARIWCTLETGAIRSKDEAADWLLEKMPEHHRPVIARAREVYLGLRSEDWCDLEGQLQSFIGHAEAGIRRLSEKAIRD